VTSSSLHFILFTDQIQCCHLPATLREFAHHVVQMFPGFGISHGSSRSNSSWLFLNTSSDTRDFALPARSSKSQSTRTLDLLFQFSFSAIHCSIKFNRCNMVARDLAFISSFLLVCFNEHAFIISNCSLSFSNIRVLIWPKCDLPSWLPTLYVAPKIMVHLIKF